ncbi:flagellin [uncultured Amnibacterium sp.]|uniref:flagellin N-terminal helical domain-containing protein n=1 Tax=uncultured Amnibacterium sp. TaxID=1631851 RepID=UPI0035CA3F56
MGFSINTNLDALNTYKNLQGVQNSLSKSLEKLSSGLRINNAGDDAAGLTIATQLGSQVSGLTQAARNAQDGVSVVQTADGALTQTQSLLGRLRDLAVQAANDSNSTTARTAIATEARSITDELSRLSTSVNFNGQKLLDGSTSNMKFQVGADGDSVSRITVDLSGANLTNVAAALNNGTTSSGTTWSSAATAGATDFVSTLANGTTTTVSVTLAAGDVTSYGATASKLNGSAAFAAKFNATVVKDANGAATGIQVTAKDGGTVSSAAYAGGVAGSSTTGIQFDTADHAQAAILAIDTQINSVSGARANIGALENRFASAVSTITTSITNLTAAKARITDVDMASEMVNYSRANILSQSGTAMLAQANSLPQLALKLLG